MAVADVPSEVRVFASLRQAWTNMWSAFWILLGLTVIVVVASIAGQPGSFLSEEAGWQMQLAWGLFGLAMSVFVIGPLTLGLVKAHLAVTRGQKPAFDDLGYGFSRYLDAVLVTLLSFLIIAAGFILLIIPGIYLAVKLMFTTQRFVDDELSPVEAIKASWADTQGRWWRTFGLALLSIPLFIAGLLALGVGVLVAHVLVGQMNAVYWRSIAQTIGE